MSATPTSTAPLLEVRDIEKSFPGVRALSGVSFDVQRRRGSRAARRERRGQVDADQDRVRRLSAGRRRDPDRRARDALRRARRRAKRAGVATIYQELLLFPELTVAENIFLGHAPLRRRRPDRLARHAGGGRGAARLARDRRPRRRPDRRRAVGRQPPAGRDPARAVARRAHPDHGRADRRADREPTSRACSTSSAGSRARGVGIVYISHRLDEMFEIADRVTVLRDGAYVGSRAMARDQCGRTRADDGRAAHREPLSQDRRADRRAGARGARSRPPADDPERQPDRARGRDRRPRRARRLGAQRARADPVRDHAGRAGRDPAQRRGRP